MQLLIILVEILLHKISNSNNSLIKDCLSISGEDYDVYIGDNNVNNTF